MLVLFSQVKSASSPSSACTPQLPCQGLLQWGLGSRPCPGANRSVMVRPTWMCRLLGLSWTYRSSPLPGDAPSLKQEAHLPTGSTNPPGEKTKWAAGHAALSRSVQHPLPKPCDPTAAPSHPAGHEEATVSCPACHQVGPSLGNLFKF